MGLEASGKQESLGLRSVGEGAKGVEYIERIWMYGRKR